MSGVKRELAQNLTSSWKYIEAQDYHDSSAKLRGIID